MSGSRDAIQQGRRSAAPDILAEKKENNAESAEKTTADPGIALETGHREQDEPDRKRRDNEGGEKANRDEAECVGNGGVDGCIEAAADCPEIVHVSRSLMQASLLVVLLAMTAAVCGPVALWFAGFACLSLTVFLTVFYVAFRRNHSGGGMDMTQALLALLVTALALLMSGNAFGALLITSVAVGLCGAVAGTWLALLGARTGRTFRQVLAAVFDPKGSRSWSLAR